MQKKSFAFTPSWKYLKHSNVKREKQNSYINRPSKQKYHSFLKHTNNGINECGEKTTTHVKHPDLFRLILSERAWRLLVHFRYIKCVCMKTYKKCFDILFNLSLLCRLLSVWFLKCDSGTWKTRKWNTASRMLCTSFTTTHQAWPETTPRSLGKVPRKSSGEKLKLRVYGLLPSNHKVMHVPALHEALVLVVLSN